MKHGTPSQANRGPKNPGRSRRDLLHPEKCLAQRHRSLLSYRAPRLFGGFGANLKPHIFRYLSLALGALRFLWRARSVLLLTLARIEAGQQLKG